MLDGKVALVTGAARWLGKGYAETLAGKGAAVVVADINAEGAEAVAAGIREAGGQARAVVMDVADEASVAAGFAEVEKTLGPVAVLVNNAGGLLAPTQAAEAFSVEQWTRAVTVNLTGSWLCARAAIPGMKAARWGRIVNITSTTLDYGLPTEMVPYISAKGGVMGLTRSLARELGPYEITVNAVAPGLIQPKVGREGRVSLSEEKLKSIFDLVIANQCIRRQGEVDDLVGPVAFLASDEARFITGQVINVDGGWALK
ncbi:SDR family NAD(P)-dependent oxidoreductase [Phenylobacterium sp. J367]|uniref:SDR family NAD(P)-dependent oxidoreductase n=1 Tax=Phenylobacterium sp. J367 TaxID=2898435 RepID=UPI002150738C|nr:SDR family NAD(P)-dependent oxidoreductase [Phenylobacterium sp. J367]MCR5878496.1 SDR family oxidoreductase [Phenylobacterium sp. J367]